MNTSNIQQILAANPAVAKEAEDRMQAMLVRSATDMDFRAKLLSDPRAAIAEFTGHELPAGYRVKFVENKAHATIVLPAAVDTAAELSENELEAVAGGTLPYVIVATVALAYAAYEGYEDGASHK